MARTGMLENNKKRQQLIQKYASQRKALKDIISNIQAAPEERYTAVQKLEKLPRNSSKVRYRFRCAETGRPRGNMRFFGLSRTPMRDYAVKGQLPGVRRSSW